ncbi:hypothetical protein [Bradyrhizobium sp. 138]|nr:hypothetical protein [Bradyrhizobium sp. 138]
MATIARNVLFAGSGTSLKRFKPIHMQIRTAIAFVGPSHKQQGA